MFVPKVKRITPTLLTNMEPLLVHGQGVFLFEAVPGLQTSTFYILDKNTTDGLCIEFGKNYVHVNYLRNLKPLSDPTNTQGLIPNHGAFYWFSLDSQNQKIYAGIGEPRLDTVIYQYTFPYFEKKFFESLTSIQYFSCNPKKILRDPITRKIPFLVKNTDELTMMDVANGTILPKANLSPIAQKMYDCIAGKKFVLDDTDFPYFSEAIEHSIKTPGCWCHTRLAQKAKEFSKDSQPLETYLRITLGENNGESPGIPYVMEIWPIGHYSPIHSHADAHAVIRVLHGKIHVHLFPFLCDDKNSIKEFAAVDFVKDDITWISPTLNQVHRLTNLGTETCITIQCYMYDEMNKGHYDYFDYLDGDGAKQQYTPDSDMDFMAFKALMKREWMECLQHQQIYYTIK